MEEKRINDDVELYLASDEPVEAENEPTAEDPTVEPTSVKKNTPKAVRVGEVPEFRGRNKKRFKMSDGTEQEVFYASDVHVLDDETGQYDDIENTLTEDEDGKHLVCGRHSFVAKFSNDEKNDELFSIEQGKHKVTVLAKKNHSNKNKDGMLGIRKRDLDSENMVVRFSGIEEDSIYEYSVKNDGIKENIIVDKARRTYRYPFILKCENVKAVFDAYQKRIAFTDLATGDEIFHIPAPFMFDSKNVTSKAVSYKLEEEENGDSILTIIADSEWINDKERAFPVVIDPQINVTSASLLATYSWSSNNSMQRESEHLVGIVATSDSASATCKSRHRMYLDFNSPTLSLGARIKKAELKVYRKGDPATSVSAPLGLYHVSDELCDYCYYEPGIDEELIDYDDMNVIGSDICYSFDITNFIDRLNNGEAYNNKFAVKLVDETMSSNNNIVLYGATSAYAPELVIDYESNYAVNTSYQAHTHTIGKFGQAAIDLQYGNLTFDSTDFSWSGNRMPVTIKHFYNSVLYNKQYTKANISGLADFSAMNVGHGFRLNLMQCVCPVGDKYVYVDEYGVETILELDTNECTYKNKDGDISYNVCNSILSIGDEKLKFENDRLVEITSGKNTTKINYDSDRINSVVDSVGRVFKFKYYGANLTSIIAPDNTKIQYAYSGNYLSTIIYPDNTKAVIEYSSYKPTAVTIKNADNVSLYKIVYTFNGYKVASVTEYGASGNSFVQGAKSEFSYSMASKRTIVTTTEVEENDSDVIKTVYTFDDDGNVVSDYVYSEETGNTGVDGTVSGIHPYVADGGANIIRNNTNLLSNHTFKDELHGWVASDKCCCCTDIYTAALDDKLTKHALVIDSHDTEKTNNTVSQDTISLSAGEYTFSAYVKVARKFCGESSGVFIRVSSADGEVLAISEKLDAYDSQYVRLIAPFTIDAAQSVKVEFVLNGDGCVHVCAPQLEDNPFANDYNMLENGNFERDTASWYTSANCSAVSDTRFNMSKSMRIIGDVKREEFCYQMIEPICSRSVRETFTLSGWAKGYGLPMHDRNGSNVPSFRLRAVIHYLDGTTETHTADFSSCTDEWQFTSLQFSKGKFKAVSYIYIYCDYDYNFGTVFFDDIQLIRNSVETDLSASDFVIESDEDTSDEDVSEVKAGNSEDYDEDKDFKEALDEFANAITETTFTDGEFGTIYRSFGFTDNGNDLISETDARGYNTTYDVEANTSRNKEVADRLGNKTAYEYDNSGRTTKVTSKKADGTELAHVSYAYDAFDNMTEIVRGDGMKYALAYNEFHNLESIGIDGKAESLIKYTYKNGNGRLKQMTYANGHTMKAVYNSIGQMVAEKWFETEATAASSTAPPIAHYKYVYDNSGNIVRSIDICAKKEYTYQYEEGRIVRAAEADIELSGEIVTAKVIVNTVRYHYDTEGKMTKKVITPASGSAQTVYYENPDDNTVVKFSAGGRTITSHSKTDSFGRKVFDELQLGTGFVSRQFSYMPGAITDEHQENHKIKSTATTQLVSHIALSDGRTISYEYDNEERITKVTDSVDGTTEYTYDALGQLLTEKITKNGVTTVVNSMEYDNYGNITKKNGKTYTYGNATWKDLLTGFDGKAIEYDAQGNPVKYLGHTLTWEKGRQLKKFDNIEYTYNANGIRTSKKVNGVLHTYTLDGTKILRETWGGNTLVPLYDNEDGVCGILYNSIPYYFIKNLQGDVIAIVDKDAQTVARYSYDAWGVPEVKFDSSECQIATINPFRYRGYYYDEEISLYYLMARYYSSRIGRFINGDLPEWIGTNSVHICNNLFAYCKNDCVNDEDETGHGGIESLISALNSALDILKNILDMIRNSYYKERVQLENSVKLLTKKQRNHLADIKSLNADVKRIKKYLGWVGNALLFATFAVILGTAYSTGSSIDRAILDCGVEYLISTIVEGAGTLFQKVAKYIPYIGFLIGLIGGWLLSYGLSKLFNSKKAQCVKNRFASLIKNVRTTFWNWLVNGIKSLSA